MITTEQWQDIEKELLNRSPHVKFRLGEDEVTVVRVEKSEGSYPLFVFINGDANGEWFDQGEWSISAPVCAHLVWNKKSQAKYKGAAIKRVEKQLGKKKALIHYPELHSKISFSTPFHNSAHAVVKQFLAITSLEVVDIGHPKFSTPEALTAYIEEIINDGETFATDLGEK